MPTEKEFQEMDEFYRAEEVERQRKLSEHPELVAMLRRLLIGYLRVDHLDPNQVYEIRAKGSQLNEAKALVG